ncbi:hypothetical protein FRB90_002931 [Tulasnella sp. 427]|nr:hypothetical protein FRB90_002931 [Tulasnella sp. 427]
MEDSVSHSPEVNDNLHAQHDVLVVPKAPTAFNWQRIAIAGYSTRPLPPIPPNDEEHTPPVAEDKGHDFARPSELQGNGYIDFGHHLPEIRGTPLSLPANLGPSFPPQAPPMEGLADELDVKDGVNEDGRPREVYDAEEVDLQDQQPSLDDDARRWALGEYERNELPSIGMASSPSPPHPTGHSARDPRPFISRYFTAPSMVNDSQNVVSSHVDLPQEPSRPSDDDEEADRQESPPPQVASYVPPSGSASWSISSDPYPPTPPPKDPQFAQAVEGALLDAFPMPPNGRTGPPRMHRAIKSEPVGSLDPTWTVHQRRASEMPGYKGVFHLQNLPLRGREIQKGYYRMYSPSGLLFSMYPVFSNDASVSSFDVEHVPPPRAARNYIAYIAQRERVKPSGVKMYISRSKGSITEVLDMDEVVDYEGSLSPCGLSMKSPLLFVVKPNNDLPGRIHPAPVTLSSLGRTDPDEELQRAYYRLFGLASSARGTQRPMPSQNPLYGDDPSLSSLVITHVPPPLRAKDYIAHIGALEGIHPSRITLFLKRPQSVPGDTLDPPRRGGETREITDLQSILSQDTASRTSEGEPIMVNVQLGVDENGDVDFETKGAPSTFSRLAIERGLRLSGWLRRRNSRSDPVVY